jgi:DNA polymerase-3 subunit gamma/tau
VAAALEATTNGGNARIQLELVLVKAAAPELDPSRKALLARIERLEAGMGPGPRAEVRGPAAESAAPGAQPPDAGARVAAGLEAAPGPVVPPAVEPVVTRVEPVVTRVEPVGPRVEPVGPRVEPVVTAAEPGPVLPPGAVDLSGAAELWPAVIAAVREENGMLAALLEQTYPVSLSGGELTVEFPADLSFMKRKAEQDDNRRLAMETFRAVTGSALALRYELADPDAAGAGAGRALSGDELVQRFMVEFNAEELSHAREEDQS